MAFQYPKEVSQVIRQQQFSLRSELTVAKTYDEKSPSNPFGVYSAFSRFVACIVNKEKKPAIANIPIVDLADLFDRTSLATLLAETRQAEQAGECASPAYTVKLASGSFKGKTPAEVLGENPEHRDALIRQWEFLKENLERFPANQLQMDAIVDACNLQKAGKLEKAQASVFDIYISDQKYLRSRQRADGMVLVYQISVSYHFGDNYPVDVTITNYYAPIEKDSKTGMTHILSSQRDASTVLINAMKLTRAEWLNCVREMKTHMVQFEMLHAKEIFADAEKCDRENRENYNNSKEGYNA